jgi:hypothetical protein
MVFQQLQKSFQLNNWSIRYKLILHFLLISILPSLVIGLLRGQYSEYLLFYFDESGNPGFSQ